MSPKPIVDRDYLAARKTLVKALHTRTTVPRLAVFVIESGKFGALSPKQAVDRALTLIGQGGEWDEATDTVYAKCIETTKALLAERKG